MYTLISLNPAITITGMEEASSFSRATINRDRQNILSIPHACTLLSRAVELLHEKANLLHPR